ncbi:MAG TPA: HD domain-containing phosphohydrolase [Verrucomicrobiae bacterium]|jgi:response regulator RpfG family c-di-GMP phosphodiesterase|nr:HD domain-containing phosphohydrolase [Verrucomicrobiae bacterium]
MSARILLVDDDKYLLASMNLVLQQKFQVTTAESGEEGLAQIETNGPFAVVISDRQMPGMDGIEFLSRVRKLAPDTVRVMLTGNVELEHAVRVVNEGNIFRFLLKPCSKDDLLRAADDAAALYRLVVGEKDLLNKTLNGSIKLLTDIVTMIDAKSFQWTERLRALAAELAPKIPLADSWEFNIAAMLSPIGNVTLPHETLVNARAGKTLSKTEQQLVNNLPEISARLLSNIPRLESVAKITLYQRKHFDGAGFPADAVKGEQIPAEARLLKILNDLLELQAVGKKRQPALAELAARPAFYDPQLLQLVQEVIGAGPDTQVGIPQKLSVTVNELKEGMILESEIKTVEGMLILSPGNPLNRAVLEKIQNFHLIYGIQEPISVKTG